jgi:hypothetical protein
MQHVTKLTDLQLTLADCPKARSVGVHDRCKAVYEGPENPELLYAAFASSCAPAPSIARR